MPLRYGLLALADVGRVFVSGESSNKWHPGVGGGAWLALHAAGCRASWPFRVFFGGSWREDWITAIRVRKLDLSTFDGGLTPVRRGGGQQTKSLRLKSANGGF